MTTATRQIQVILFEAMREAAKITAQNMEGVSILTMVFAESYAAIVTEIMAQGERLREPGGVEAVVKASIEPVEEMLRKNIADYLATEQREAAASPKH